MNEKDIVSYTGEALKQRKSRTNLGRLNAMTEAELEQNALSDADAPPITSEQLRQAVLIVPDEAGKERIAMWIDQDILSYYGKGTKGYQKRLNTALRRMMAIELLYGDNQSA